MDGESQFRVRTKYFIISPVPNGSQSQALPVGDASPLPWYPSPGGVSNMFTPRKTPERLRHVVRLKLSQSSVWGTCLPRPYRSARVPVSASILKPSQSRPTKVSQRSRHPLRNRPLPLDSTGTEVVTATTGRPVCSLLVQKEQRGMKADQHRSVSLLVPRRRGTMDASQHFLSLKHAASVLRLL